LKKSNKGGKEKKRSKQYRMLFVLQQVYNQKNNNHKAKHKSVAK